MPCLPEARRVARIPHQRSPWASQPLCLRHICFASRQLRRFPCAPRSAEGSRMDTLIKDQQSTASDPLLDWNLAGATAAETWELVAGELVAAAASGRHPLHLPTLTTVGADGCRRPGPLCFDSLIRPIVKPGFIPTCEVAKSPTCCVSRGWPCIGTIQPRECRFGSRPEPMCTTAMPGLVPPGATQRP